MESLDTSLLRSMGEWISLAFERVGAGKQEQRWPICGDRWREWYVNELEAAAMTADESLECSHSVFTITEVANMAECAAIASAAIAAADRERATRASGPSHDLQGLQIDGKDGKIRGRVIDLVDTETQVLCDAILVRAGEALSERLPQVLPRMFGPGALATSILFNTELIFSPGEPALNVYTSDPAGCHTGAGGFDAHEDKQSLTLLVPLSTCRDIAGAMTTGDFDSGGTAFWTRADASGVRGAANHPPSEPKVVLQPEPGTAIVFGGKLTHAGRPVLGGQRCVLVASFSARERLAGTDPDLSDSLVF